MENLLLAFSELLPESILIEKLKLDIEKYQCDPTEENRNAMAMGCMMIVSKLHIETTEGGLEEVVRRAEDIKAAQKIFNPDKN